MSKPEKLWLYGRSWTNWLPRAVKTALMAGLLFGVGAAAPPQAVSAGKPLVHTKEGPVQGFIVNGVAEFLGIPYAEPPVGNLRWRPPKRHAPWTTVKEATAFGPICAQITTLGVFAGPANNNEDCLFLNVYTPNLDPDAGLPVIVWIHGGGNLDGETPGYDGSKLAAQGHTVVVTIEYRLNLMGWLAHPALDNEGHLFGNYGTLDQLLALKWVRRNIAQFGGDNDNVTLGGQSAGAVDTGIAMVSPLFAGLFHRGICESFCPSFPLATLASAEKAGVAFAVAAGCGSGTDAATAKCLRSLPAAKIEELAGTASAASQFVVGTMVDGTVIPEQPLTAFINGHFSHVPLMNGNTEDEQTFSLAIMEFFSGPPRVPPTAAQYIDFVKTTYVPPAYLPGTAAKVLALYPLSAFATPELAWNRAGTDPGICSERRLDKILAPEIPLYTYEFDDQTAPYYFPKMPGFLPLASHTSDIQYLFPLWHGGPSPPSVIHTLNDKQEDLSDQLVAAWANFAWTGNPNGLGNSPWPRYRNTANRPAWLIQDLPVLSTLTDDQYSALRNCDFWDSVSTVTH